jgi:CheY-like chemotaxis protein
MSPQVLSRVFEPFFTTKEVGKGSGLGLSQVYGFARQSGGHVDIHSEVGKGTSVRLLMPWTQPVKTVVRKDAEPLDPIPVDRLNILVVEDDDDLRELATQLVQGLGYAACSASTGAAAIATLERDPNIGLLFTDILMPGGMNGFELAAEVRRRRPEIGILTTSAFPGNFTAGAQLCGDFDIIRKPFTQAELAAALLKVRIPSVNEHKGDRSQSQVAGDSVSAGRNARGTEAQPDAVSAAAALGVWQAPLPRG